MRQTRSVHQILSMGFPVRVWPYSDGSRLVITTAMGRPGRFSKTAIHLSHDGETWNRISLDARRPEATSTGQPFLSMTSTLLVPVWDVRFYTEGLTYFGIYRSADLGDTWELVYEDWTGTYANHFFESAGGAHICIGVGVGKQQNRRFTPHSGYLLCSDDDGRSWSRKLAYERPCALYDGCVSDKGDYLLAARESNNLLLGCLADDRFREIMMGRPCRNAAYIADIDKYIVTSDSSVLISSDRQNWTILEMPIRRLPLRYPIYNKGLFYLSATGWSSLIVATDLEKWYLIEDLSGLSRSGFGRIALFRDQIYCGSEFDGKLVRVSLSRQPQKLGLVHRTRYFVRRSLGARNTFSELSALASPR